jgi:hypothetical protein
VGGVVVHDGVDFEPFGHVSVDLLEEVQELGRPMSLVAFADDEARCDVERCEQRCCAVPHVTVRPAFGYAGHHRQDRLLPIQRLDLAFLVNAKDKRSVGVARGKGRISRTLSTNGGSFDSLTVWLRCTAGRTPPTHGGSSYAKSRFQPPSNGSTGASRRQAWCALSARSQRQPGRRRWSRSAGASLVEQTIKAIR